MNLLWALDEWMWVVNVFPSPAAFAVSILRWWIFQAGFVLWLTLRLTLWAQHANSVTRQSDRGLLVADPTIPNEIKLTPPSHAASVINRISLGTNMRHGARWEADRIGVRAEKCFAFSSLRFLYKGLIWAFYLEPRRAAENSCVCISVFIRQTLHSALT